MSNDITYMWKLKKMMEMNLFKNRNISTDIKNKLMVTKRDSRGGRG